MSGPHHNVRSSTVSLGAALEEIVSDYTECGVCLSECDLRLLPCQHRICLQCLKRIVESTRKQPRCAYCRKPLSRQVENYPVCRLSKKIKEKFTPLVEKRKQSKKEAAELKSPALQKSTRKTEPNIGTCDTAGCQRVVDVLCVKCNLFICYRCSKDNLCRTGDSLCETVDFQEHFMELKYQLESHRSAIVSKRDRLTYMIQKDVKLMSDLADGSEESESIFDDLESSIAARNRQIKKIDEELSNVDEMLDLDKTSQKDFVWKLGCINLTVMTTMSSGSDSESDEAGREEDYLNISEFMQLASQDDSGNEECTEDYQRMDGIASRPDHYSQAGVLLSASKSSDDSSMDTTSQTKDETMKRVNDELAEDDAEGSPEATACAVPQGVTTGGRSTSDNQKPSGSWKDSKLEKGIDDDDDVFIENESGCVQPKDVTALRSEKPIISSEALDSVTSKGGENESADSSTNSANESPMKSSTDEAAEHNESSSIVREILMGTVETAIESMNLEAEDTTAPLDQLECQENSKDSGDVHNSIQLIGESQQDQEIVRPRPKPRRRTLRQQDTIYENYPSSADIEGRENMDPAGESGDPEDGLHPDENPKQAERSTVNASCELEEHKLSRSFVSTGRMEGETNRMQEPRAVTRAEDKPICEGLKVDRTTKHTGDQDSIVFLDDTLPGNSRDPRDAVAGDYDTAGGKRDRSSNATQSESDAERSLAIIKEIRRRSDPAKSHSDLYANWSMPGQNSENNPFPKRRPSRFVVQNKTTGSLANLKSVGQASEKRRHPSVDKVPVVLVAQFPKPEDQNNNSVNRIATTAAAETEAAGTNMADGKVTGKQKDRKRRSMFYVK